MNKAIPLLLALGLILVAGCEKNDPKKDPPSPKVSQARSLSPSIAAAYVLTS